ncbi:MAG: PASTA domain-containing protein [Candidatus Bruticola sp.]
MIGTTVADRYEIISQLGVGGMAKVYKAKDLNLGRDVALKVLLESVSNDPEFRERFRREARASAALSHPNIVRVYDFFEAGKDIFLIMEFIEGRDLRDLMQEHGRLSPDEAVRITIDVLSALEFAHSRGVVHRDISARNVMLGRDGSVKVTDFGIARIVGERTLTQSGELIGSVQYISPEQASGGHATPAADIYSTGVLLYEMLTGELPFSSDNVVKLALMHVQSPIPKPSVLCPQISEALDNIVLKAMSKNPVNRYRSAGEMMEALQMLRVSVAPPASVHSLGQGTAPALSGSGSVVQAAPSAGASLAGSFYGAAAGGGTAPLLAGGTEPGSVTERTMLRTRLPQNLLKMQEDSLAVAARPLDGSSPVDTVDLSYTPDEEEYQELGSEGYEEYVAEDGEDYEYVEGENEAEDSSAIGAANHSLGAIIAISLTILIAFAAGITWVNLNAAPGVNVPSVVGQKLAQARETVKEAGLRLEVRSQKYEQGVHPGIVLSQDPVSGVQLVKDGVIWVDISLGRELIAVPDLNGLTEDRACDELNSSGLGYTIVPKESSAPSGTVFAQDPSAGQELAAGSEVTVFVSLGRGEVKIPDLTGLSLKSAADLMAGLGGSVKVRAQKDDPKAAEGTVLSQEPASGQALRRGSVIYVVICSKSNKTKQAAPSLVGKSVAEAKAEAAALGIELSIEGDSSEAARITNQNTAPGTELEGGRLIVSASAQAIIPDVCTQSYEQALQSLQNAGFKVGRISVSAGVADNVVVEQYPGGGQTAPLGSSIDLTITKATENEGSSTAAPNNGSATININSVPLKAPDPSPVAPEHSAPPAEAPQQPADGDNGNGESGNLDIELPGDLP